MSEHSPLPWMSAPTGPVMTGYVQPFGVLHLETENMICGCFGDVRGGLDTAKANSLFIVEACNSHYAQAERIKALEEVLGELFVSGRVFDIYKASTREWQDAARALLEKP